MSVREPKSRRSGRRPIVIEKQTGTYTSLGYRSVRMATSDGRSYMSYPGDAHDERDRKKLIAQSREFMRDNAIYKGMIDRMVSHVAGNGFSLQVTGVGESLAGKIEKLWRDFFKKPEVRNLLSGPDVAEMVLREIVVAGDTAVLKTNKGLVQLFEAEQIDGRKPWYPNGIKTDKYGKPTKFNLCPWKKYGIDKNKATKVPAADVLFLTRPERPSQTRGVPACQAAFPMIHRINDVCDSEAIAWQVLSRMALAITRKDGAEQAYTESRADPEKSSDQLEGDLATRLTELNYALIFHGNEGEDVKGIERNIPGSKFSESLRMFLRLLGLPLGMPLELVLLDWTQSNYSQSRAVLEQTYKTFTRWQHKLTTCFYRPLFDWKLSQWRTQGLVGKSAKLEISFVTPTFPWLDQLKEAKAYGEKVTRGFTTHGQVCKSLNSDRTEVVDQREKEIRDAIERAEKIKADTSVEVPWQIFCGLEAPKAATATRDEGDEGDEGTKRRKDDDDE